MNHQYTETVHLKAVYYLLSQLSSSYLESQCDDGEEERFNLTTVKNVLEKFKKGHGKIVTSYKKSATGGDPRGIYRSYVKQGGLQGMPTAFRGLLCQGLNRDLDMVNAYPTILYNLCIKHDITCHQLKEYCLNRKELLSRGTFTKIDVLKCINKGKKNKHADPWINGFDMEIKQIQSKLIPHFQEMYADALLKKGKNPVGTFMTNVCSYYENLFLEAIVELVKSENVSTLMFDGCMIYTDIELDSLSNLIQEKFGFDMKFSFKEHDQSIIIPDDFKIEDEDAVYHTLKQKYEIDYTLGFIQKSGNYSFRINDAICFVQEEHLTRILNTELIGSKHFFTLWKADPLRKTYTDVGMFPHDVEVLDGYLNIWSGFAVEKLKEPIVDIQPILSHIKIMMNHHDESYEFFLNWLANLFQYPSSTSIFISISSKEGAGKSALIDLLTAMVGESKSREVNDMKNELFGSFNDDLRDAVLMNINEVERADAGQCYERMKSQITSPTIRVHPKGQTPYYISNLRKFISTNNNPHAIVIKKGNRRYFATESSNELIGQTDYFTWLYTNIKKPCVQYSFYNFLMDRDVKKQLTQRDIPETPLMQEAYELNTDPIEDYLATLPRNEKIYSQDMYTGYKQYMGTIGMTYTINAKQFDMKIGRLITDKPHQKGREDKMVDGERIRKSFLLLG